MSFPPRPKRFQAQTPEPQFGSQRNAAAPVRNAAAARADGGAPLRFPGERLRERETSDLPPLTAGERIIVSSVIAGGDRPSRGLLRPIGFAVLCLCAVVGVVTIYHSLAGAFPH
jgi:hypothetical protein